MFVRVKVISKQNYYYLVQNNRVGNTVKQTVIKYLGKTKPGPQAIANIMNSTVVPKKELRGEHKAGLE